MVDKDRELRWIGHLIVKGLFDGQHYWVLSCNASGGTDIVHGENFKGVLVGVVKPERLKDEFDRMNRDMAAEIVRRYPVSTSVEVDRAHDKAGLQFLGGPRRREAAGGRLNDYKLIADDPFGAVIQTRTTKTRNSMTVRPNHPHIISWVPLRS